VQRPPPRVVSVKISSDLRDCDYDTNPDFMTKKSDWKSQLTIKKLNFMNVPRRGYSSTSCWTCRRRRLKCDRALPECHKCSASEHPCQGYSESRPLRWTNGIASRGKLMGKRVPIIDVNKSCASIMRSLEDPAVQDLSPINRGYIKYCRYMGMEKTMYQFLTRTS
jgi:hypothetical protein